jgi:hypothetical protein
MRGIMINIATVHWQDDSWIDVQLDHLKRNMTEPFRVYAWLNDVPGDHRHKFHYVNTEPVPQHAVKLNILADLIYFDSNRDDDLIIFLDGDAFPIGDFVGFVRQKLKQYPLVAVQRSENNGDLQPHPCCCVTTVAFWRKIGGDWKQGYTWVDPQGKSMTDVGGNLLGILHREKVDWYPMHRSNRVNLHPLWFGIYDGLIYHHGAAFRGPFSRTDLEKIEVETRGTWRRPLAEMIKRLDPSQRSRLLRRLDPVHSLARRTVRRNQELSARIFDSLRSDPEFYREFVGPAAGRGSTESVN